MQSVAQFVLFLDFEAEFLEIEVVVDVLEPLLLDLTVELLLFLFFLEDPLRLDLGRSPRFLLSFFADFAFKVLVGVLESDGLFIVLNHPVVELHDFVVILLLLRAVL